MALGSSFSKMHAMQSPQKPDIDTGSLERAAPNTKFQLWAWLKYSLLGVLLSLFVSVISLNLMGSSNPGARAEGPGAILALLFMPGVLIWMVLAGFYPLLFLLYAYVRGAIPAIVHKNSKAQWLRVLLQRKWFWMLVLSQALLQSCAMHFLA